MAFIKVKNFWALKDAIKMVTKITHRLEKILANHLSDKGPYDSILITKTILKMGKGSQQTFLQRRNANGQ